MDSESAPSDPILDYENALARLGGDRVLFAEMAGLLFEDLPKLRDQLHAAVAEGDPIRIRMNAHALKGLVAGCGGVQATNAAQALEDAGHSRDLRQAGALFDSLTTELDALTQALAEYSR